MAKQETQIQKHCRIKTGGLRRYRKEYLSYVKEVKLDTQKIDSAKIAGKDSYFVKKLEEVLRETQAMVPHIKEKILDSVTDLEMYLEENEESADLEGSELLENAKTELKESETFLETIEKEEEEEEEQLKLQQKQQMQQDGADDDDEEIPMDDEDED